MTTKNSCPKGLSYRYGKSLVSATTLIVRQRVAAFQPIIMIVL